ncbi:MAG: MMPL family transporter [Dehalococcoidia bacterium]
MNGPGITERLAAVSARHPWLVVASWIALFVLGGFLASGVGDALTSEISFTNEPESVKADNLLEERLRGPEMAIETVIVESEGTTIDDPAFQSFVGDLLADIRGLDGVVEQATSYYETNDARLVSPDGDKTILPVWLAGDAEEASDNVGPFVDVVHQADGSEGFRVLAAGNGSIGHEVDEISESDLQRGEIIGIPIALVILLLVFGAAVAAGIPIIVAVLSIVMAVGSVAVLGELFEFNLLVVNMITMIGLAVGIDYSLFIIHRYREERVRGLDKQAAIARTGGTAGRAVLFSGGTVVVGLLGMLIIPASIYRSLAAGAIIVAIITVIASLTLLPAILSILGDRVNSLRVPFLQRLGSGDGPGFWGRAASLVMARPLVSAALVVGLLMVAAVPFFSLNQGLPGVSTLPPDSESRQAFEILNEDFSAGLISPTEIVVDAANVNAPDVQSAIGDLTATLAEDPMFGPVEVETNDAGDLALLSTIIDGDANADPAYDAAQRLRDDYIPAAFAGVDAEVLVAGDSAQALDLFQMIDRYTPIVFGFVLGLSFLLLLVVFRSIVVPIKALIMNLLSVGATYGLIVLVFQHGVGNELFGFQQSDTIAAWLPLFLFAILFGLSMDYHVFLLSRIRERWDQTHDNKGSVAFGVRTTAGIITGAALIMVAVFAGFAMGDLVDLQQSGFGLAVAVILDATIVRSVLVPSTMALLGDLNWYLPRWLEWLPDVRVDGGQETAPRPSAGGTVDTFVGGGQ